MTLYKIEELEFMSNDAACLPTIILFNVKYNRKATESN